MSTPAWDYLPGTRRDQCPGARRASKGGLQGSPLLVLICHRDIVPGCLSPGVSRFAGILNGLPSIRLGPGRIDEPAIHADRRAVSLDAAARAQVAHQVPVQSRAI